jgi:hypothetical protein
MISAIALPNCSRSCRQRRDEAAELRADLRVEGGRGAVTGVGQRHLQRPPVAWHGDRRAKYQTKTDRELPVIRLVPRSAPDAPHE